MRQEKDGREENQDRRGNGDGNSFVDQDEDDEETALLPHRRPTEVTSTRYGIFKKWYRFIIEKTKSWMNPALGGALVAV